MPASVRGKLLDRLRADPIASTVPGSLPVLFFGDLPAARVATIGINPSKQEYLSPRGAELDGPMRRFETLRSLGVERRSDLSTAHAGLAVERMRSYFDDGRPVYPWFSGLSRVVDGMGLSFAGRSVAHLDLVQEATDPVWSGLWARDRDGAAAVLWRDLQFLRWQIEAYPLRAVVCTSATAMRHVWPMLDVRDADEGTLARVRWRTGIADMPRGRVGVAGWNIPLARPTGLDRDRQRTLGATLAAALSKLGCDL